MRMLRRFEAIGLSILGCLVLACEAQPQARPIPGTPFEQREVTDGQGRTITYYISHPKKPTAPILLMIQGSGCDRVINVRPGSSFSTIFGLVPFAEDGEFTVVAVEKPYSGRSSGGPSGSARTCSTEFNADFTAESWLVALGAALADARKSPWIDKRRTLVFGFSEGAVMASLLAGRDRSITDAIAISGSGTTQLFDFVALAYRQCFDASVCLSDVEANLQAINAKPDSATDFAWGHPYKRWTSFFRIDPGEELLRSEARVYIAFGTADQSVPALSAELAVARLKLAARDVTVRRVPNAGHTLSDSGPGNFDDMDKEFRAALRWFWREGR